jgi:aspartate/methionine/tyrosine aminotransferase
MSDQDVTMASGRVSKVNPFKVMAVLLRAKELEAQGRKIVHMEVGEPDFVTADPIICAGQQALRNGHTHYSAAAGIPQLRSAISNFYSERYNVSVSPQRIFITPGASGGLNLLANLLIDSGDQILMADPAYPCNRNFVHLMNGQPQMVEVGAQTNFQPDVAMLSAHLNEKTTGLWLASPANPTGTVIERKQLEELYHWSAQQRLHLVMDEIYHGLDYHDDLPSLLEITDQAFVVNSFSKYFGMTGWRIGWIVVPHQYINLVEILCQNLFIAASTISQHAALAAFSPEAMAIHEQRRTEFKVRRDFLSSALLDIGFDIPTIAQGAFYLYADISRFASNSESFCQEMLEQHGVAITPGTDFGTYQSDRFVRFAFTTDMANLETGVERLRAALSE